MFTTKIDEQRQKRDAMELESRQLEQTLSKLTSELSEAFTSIDTLVAKINVSPKEKSLAENAPLLSIIGE